jgi:hypothetical protein
MLEAIGLVLFCLLLWIFSTCRCSRRHDQLDRIEDHLGALTTRLAQTATKEDLMAGEQAILDRVRAQSTVIESVRVLVQALKDAADDPVKTAEILAALDANDAALAVVAGTPAA